VPLNRMVESLPWSISVCVERIHVSPPIARDPKIRDPEIRDHKVNCGSLYQKTKAKKKKREREREREREKETHRFMSIGRCIGLTAR
jgi:hypothetical protein